MPPQFNRYNGFGIFDDKGEVKRLVEYLIQNKDPEVTIDRLRKFEFSYLFTLSKGWKTKEVELTRSEIEASWDWKRGNVDETLEKKINDTIAQL
jgi:hypothetical protein